MPLERVGGCGRVRLGQERPILNLGSFIPDSQQHLKALRGKHLFIGDNGSIRKTVRFDIHGLCKWCREIAVMH